MKNSKLKQLFVILSFSQEFSFIEVDNVSLVPLFWSLLMRFNQRVIKVRSCLSIMGIKGQ